MPERTFPLGQVVITAAARNVLDSADVELSLGRHNRCDWGEVDRHDWQENEVSLMQGLRLLSVYRDRNQTKFWIITEADRSATTILLPDDY